MQYGKSLLATGLLLSLTTLNAQASLSAYTAAGNQSVVYSSVSNVTWTGDANLLGTMIANQGYNTVVNVIMAASPVIIDTPNYYDGFDGSYSISAADFSSSLLGRATWFGAKAFANYLNSINYAGSNQWALPSAGANPQGGYNPIGSQFGQLFYNELGGTAGNNIPNTANFTNEQVSTYWLDSEYEESKPGFVPSPQYAWIFSTHNGHQNIGVKNSQFYAWAVSPGQVAAVPLPSAIWLFASALLGVLGLKRQRRI